MVRNACSQLMPSTIRPDASRYEEMAWAIPIQMAI
jgi:hypothetical protein